MKNHRKIQETGGGWQDLLCILLAGIPGAFMLTLGVGGIMLGITMCFDLTSDTSQRGWGALAILTGFWVLWGAQE